MPPGPAHADPASEPGDPVPTPDWMSAEEWLAWCDAAAAIDDEPPPDSEDEEEPEPALAPGDQVTGVAGFGGAGCLTA